VGGGSSHTRSRADGGSRAHGPSADPATPLGEALAERDRHHRVRPAWRKPEGPTRSRSANTQFAWRSICGAVEAVLTNVTGGLSGPAIKPLNSGAVYQVARACSIPVIGVGGISSGEDALEYMVVGARPSKVGTANLYDPGVGEKILKQSTASWPRRGSPTWNDWSEILLICLRIFSPTPGS